MLESSTEAPNLHVTAAPGYRTPKCTIPHAAYRRTEPPPKQLPVALSREGTPNAPSRAAEATRSFALQTIQTAEAPFQPAHTEATEATPVSRRFLPLTEACESLRSERGSTMRP